MTQSVSTEMQPLQHPRHSKRKKTTNISYPHKAGFLIWGPQEWGAHRDIAAEESELSQAGFSNVPVPGMGCRVKGCLFPGGKLKATQAHEGLFNFLHTKAGHGGQATS